MALPGQNDRHFLSDTAESASAPAIQAGRRGDCVRVAISEPDILSVLECGYDRLVLERSTDAGLTWAEITRPDARPVLEPGRTDYVVIDGAGDAAYRYRTRYLDSSDGECSDPSAEVAGLGLVVQSVLTVEQLKARYFFGIDITDDAGNPLSDQVFQFYILAALRYIEHQLDIPLLPTRFCDLQDYYRNDYQAFNLLQLDNYPVQEVIEFRVQYPSGQSVIEFPQEWIRLDAVAGHVQIVPTAGTLSEILVGAGGSFLPAIYNGLDFLPQLFQVDYVAGFAEGQIPANIIDLIGMAASLGPFNLFGDLIAGAGIATLSLSLDGLSQSVGTTSSATNAGYGSRIIQYTKQIKDQIPKLRKYYKRAGGLVVA
jgi:hypothetical protein